MSTSENQRLVNQQTAVDMEPPGPGSSRPYKVAGVTVLACALIASQVAIAYFLINQRGDIKSLQEQNERIRVDLTKARSVAVPMRVQMPMNTLTADLVDMETSAETTPKAAPPLTKCQRENVGLDVLPVPGFRPTCDAQGLYRAEQCFLGECWCVSPLTGKRIPGSETKGPASCVSARIANPQPIFNIEE